MTVDCSAGWVLTLIPAALVVFGLFGVVAPAEWHSASWYFMIHLTSAFNAWLCVPLGLAFTALRLWAAHRLLRAYGRQFPRRIEAKRVGDSRCSLTENQADPGKSPRYSSATGVMPWPLHLRYQADAPSALPVADTVSAVRNASTIAAIRLGSETRSRCPPW
jgi:hypothetical protein